MIGREKAQVLGDSGSLFAWIHVTIGEKHKTVYIVPDLAWKIEKPDGRLNFFDLKDDILGACTLGSLEAQTCDCVQRHVWVSEKIHIVNENPKQFDGKENRNYRSQT